MLQKHLIIGVSIFFLAACTSTNSVSKNASSSSSSSASNDLQITLQKNVVTDDSGVVRTTAALQLSGATEKTIELGEILGEVFVSDASSRTVPASSSKIELLLFAWFAGAGEEILVTQSRNPHTLLIQKRFGGEEENCTAWEVVEEVPLPGDVTVSLENFGEKSASSALQYCEGLTLQ